MYCDWRITTEQVIVILVTELSIIYRILFGNVYRIFGKLIQDLFTYKRDFSDVNT